MRRWHVTVIDSRRSQAREDVRGADDHDPAGDAGLRARRRAGACGGGAAKQAEPNDEELVRAYRWSDDLPEGAITFTGPHGSYRISFRNQQRQLVVEHGSAIDALDYRSPSPDADFGVASPVWARFTEPDVA